MNAPFRQTRKFELIQSTPRLLQVLKQGKVLWTFVCVLGQGPRCIKRMRITRISKKDQVVYYEYRDPGLAREMGKKRNHQFSGQHHFSTLLQGYRGVCLTKEAANYHLRRNKRAYARDIDNRAAEEDDRDLLMS